MLLCPRCKKENKTEDDICYDCGFPLNKNSNKLPKGLVVLGVIMIFLFTYYNVFYIKNHLFENENDGKNHLLSEHLFRIHLLKKFHPYYSLWLLLNK